MATIYFSTFRHFQITKVVLEGEKEDMQPSLFIGYVGKLGRILNAPISKDPELINTFW